MVYALEPSIDDRYVFCAGTTATNATSSQSMSMISAITFDRALKVVAERALDNPNIRACTAMKRFKNRDDLVVGGYRDMLIVRFTGTSFEILNLIQNIHSGKHAHFNTRRRLQ